MGNQLNAYFWVPEDQEAYGRMGFTATELACVALGMWIDKVVNEDAGPVTVELPGVTEIDTGVIGCGLAHSFDALVLERAEEGVVRPVFEWEPESTTLRLALNPFTLGYWGDIVRLVSEGETDMTFGAYFCGAEGLGWFWACFGHLWQEQEPVNKFPE